MPATFTFQGQVLTADDVRAAHVVVIAQAEGHLQSIVSQMDALLFARLCNEFGSRSGLRELLARYLELAPAEQSITIPRR